jgi:hypothetical protein
MSFVNHSKSTAEVSFGMYLDILNCQVVLIE